LTERTLSSVAIAEVVTELSDSVHEISNATDQQASSAEDVASVAAAEQGTVSLSTVSETVESLACEADELESLLLQFELDDAAATTGQRG